MSSLLYPILGYRATSSYINEMEKSIRTAQRGKLQDLLRQIRLEAGLRQIDLAERLDKPQSFVSKYESGERRLDLLELREVCGAADTSIEEFVYRFERSF